MNVARYIIYVKKERFSTKNRLLIHDDKAIVYITAKYIPKRIRDVAFIDDSFIATLSNVSRFSIEFQAMLILFAIFIISPAQAYERIPEAFRDRNSPSVNFHRLTRALDHVYRDGDRDYFKLNIDSEAKRYNVSESDYSGACFREFKFFFLKLTHISVSESYFDVVPYWSEIVTIYTERSELSQYFTRNSTSFVRFFA